MKRTLFVSAVILTAAAALALRLPKLSLRPMHTDEAVHAVKFADLLEKNTYRYDPLEYHGPTLYYLTLPVAWLTDQKDFTQINEVTLRLVPVLFGIATILLFLLISDAVGYPAAFIGALFATISPALVFYSRYYIHETLLVFFSFLVIAAVWRYLRSGSLGWILLAGAGVGLMHATKETCIISFAAMAITLLIIIKQTRPHSQKSLPTPTPTKIKTQHLIASLIVALGISFILFSSFFTNLRGPWDSLLTYSHYLNRAGTAGIHDHPFYYYLKMLAFTHNAPGPFWSEGLILTLALIGFSAALFPKKLSNTNIPFLRFIAIYTLILIVIYSLIPYKNPWCLLTFLHGLIILAGAGAVYLIRIIPVAFGRVIVCLFLSAAACQLIQQTYRTNFRFFADRRNPYVYAHTVTDVVRLAKLAQGIAEVHPDGPDLLIRIITEPQNYWPLPWYLRKFKRVGYGHEVPETVNAPFIVTSLSLQTGVDEILPDDYFQDIYGLRPDVDLYVYIQKKYWDAYLRKMRTTK